MNKWYLFVLLPMTTVCMERKELVPPECTQAQLVAMQLQEDLDQLMVALENGGDAKTSNESDGQECTWPPVNKQFCSLFNVMVVATTQSDGQRQNKIDERPSHPLPTYGNKIKKSNSPKARVSAFTRVPPRN